MPLQRRVLVSGNTTDFPRANDDVILEYTGWLLDASQVNNSYKGTKFDSSAAKGVPFSYRLGLGTVIKGWELAIPQMSLGEKSLWTVPPELAYGKTGYPGVVPADTPLIFELSLRAINNKRA